MSPWQEDNKIEWSDRCPWKCPKCGSRCGGIKGHKGKHQCPKHYKPPTKEVECCECGKMVEVPDDLDPEETAVFCSQRCVEAEARAVYNQEMSEQFDKEVEDE